MDTTPSQRRLQREPDFTGDKLNSFTDVLLRHGLPGLMLALLMFSHPDMLALFLATLSKAVAMPDRYIGAGFLILLGLSAYAWWIDRRWTPVQLGWIVYLGLLSIWEEWVFRVAIPYGIAGYGGDANDTGLGAAILISNALFGLAHYFTLRWKWQWCLGAFIGGLALSRQMDSNFDLALLAGIHWVATFLNTPRMPGATRNPSRLPE